MRWLSLRMAFEHLRGAIGRLALTVLAVALGVALVVSIQRMNGAVLTGFLDSVDAVSGRAALSVTAGRDLTFPEDLVEQVASVQGVQLAVPLVRAVAFPDDGSGDLLTVHGVDITHDAAVRLYHRTEGADHVVDDPLIFVSQPDSIVLAREYSQQRGLSLDDRIDLVTPNGVKSFAVRGLIDPQGPAKVLAGRLVVMDLFAAEQAFTKPGQINQIDVLVTPGFAVDDVRGAIRTILPMGLRVDEPALRKDILRKTVGGFQSMLTSFSFLAVLAGFVICYSRLGAVFEARTWEVGLLRAVGMSRPAVAGELLKEALLIGASGTLIGVPLGLAAGSVWLPTIANATALNYGMTVPSTPTAPIVFPVITGVLLGFFASLAAATVPAIRVSKLSPVVAIAQRGRELPEDRPRRRRALAAAGCAGATIAVVAQALVPRAEIGLLVTCLIGLVFTLSSREFAVGGARLLRTPWTRLFGVPGELALEHLEQQGRRTAFAIATIALGIGGVVMFGVLAWSFERTLVDQVGAQFHADVVVSSPYFAEGWISAPIDEALVDRIAGLPGVAASAGFQAVTAEIDGEPAFLFSYDPSAFLDQRLLGFPLERGALIDARERVAAGEGVLISTALARERRLGVGDLVSLGPGSSRERLPVVGVTHAEANPAVMMSRRLYRDRFADTHIREVHLAVDPRVAPSVVADAVRRTTGERFRLQVRGGPEFRQFFADQARSAFSGLYLMEAVTFVLVLIGIGDSLAVAVLERLRHFGTMRAIGLRRSDLSKIVTLESIAIGVIGLTVAGAMGGALSLYWVEVEFPMLVRWDLDLHVPLGLIAGAAVMTILIAVVAAALPALRLAMTPLSVALRNE